MKEVNNLSSEPLKLFEMFVNQKTRALCNYGQLYIYGLKCVRKDMMAKFEDMRTSIEFKKIGDINFENSFEFSHGENLSLSIIEKDFEKYFDQERLNKMVQDNLDETINPEKHNKKEKEDDLLNFSHLGMSLLEVTDLNIEKEQNPHDETTGNIDTERILGDVLKIPDDSKLNLLDDTNFEIEPKRVKKRHKGGLLFPGNDSDNERRSLSRSSQFSSRSMKKKKRRRDRSMAGKSSDKRMKSTSKKKKLENKNEILDGQIELKKPPLLLNKPKQLQGPRMRISSNINEFSHNSLKKSFKQQDFLDTDIDSNRLSSAHSVGYAHGGRQRSYTGGRLSGVGLNMRRTTPDPYMAKSDFNGNNQQDFAKSLKNFAKTTDFSSVKSNKDFKSPYGKKLPFSYRSKSPAPRGSFKSTKSPNSRNRKKRKKSEKNDSSPPSSLLKSQKPSRDTISSDYYACLFNLIDGVGYEFNFSDSMMGDRGIHFISYYMSSSLKALECLRLNNCKVTDKGVAFLCEALVTMNIQKLYLNQNLITVKGLGTLLDYVKKKPGILLISLKKNKIKRERVTKAIKYFGSYKVTLLL